MSISEIKQFLHKPLRVKISKLENDISELQNKKNNLMKEADNLILQNCDITCIDKTYSFLDFYDFVKKIKYDNSDFSKNVYRKPNGQDIEYYRVNKSHIDCLMSELAHYSEFIFIYNALTE